MRNAQLRHAVQMRRPWGLNGVEGLKEKSLKAR